MMSQQCLGLTATDNVCLLDRIKNSKELFFYCLLRPRMVSEWMNRSLTKAERRRLEDFSADLNNLYFPHGVLTEDDVVSMQSHLYYLQQERDTKAGALLCGLLFQAPACAQSLMLVLQQQRTLWCDRQQRLSGEGVLSRQAITQMTTAIDELKTDLIDLQLPANLSNRRLRVQFQAMLFIINTINTQLIEVEEAAYGLCRLHDLRSALAILVTQDKACEFNHVLKEQEGLADVLQRHIEAMETLQEKFHAYLLKQARGVRFFTSETVRNTDDVSAAPRAQF